MRVSIIVAIDKKRGIGKNNDLLFKIPEDFARMKALTLNHPIIMGRKTHESIGRILPNRTNIIITRDNSYVVDGAVVVHSLEEGLKVAEETEGSKGTNGEIFIFGGGQIFKEALDKDLVNRLYLTIVEGDYNADTFFPEYESRFKKVISLEKGESNGYKYTFLDLEK